MNPFTHFDTIVADHYDPLFRFATSLTRAESEAWDLTQHTFYMWATKGRQLRDLAKVKTWLFTTLHRAFLDGQQKQRRFPARDLAEYSETLPAATADPTDSADASVVLAALAQVDALYRSAVALFYLDDYSYQQIAARLEVPVGTVKSRISRGVAQLREILVSRDEGQARYGKPAQPV